MSYNYPEPTGPRRAELADFAARLAGRSIQPSQRDWIRRVLLVHGPEAEAALELGYRLGGWTNLFLRVVDNPPRSLVPAATVREVALPAETDGPRHERGDEDDVDLEPVAGPPETVADIAFGFDPPVSVQRLSGGGEDWNRLPGLLYSPADRPPYDPGSRLRWDDRSSNPDRGALLARHEDAKQAGR